MQFIRFYAGVLIIGGAFAAEPTLRVSEAEAKKAAIERPAPAYPMVARQLKVKGEVKLEAVVDTEGAVLEVRILSGNPILTKPAVEAVRKWRFRGFQDHGQPSAAIVALSFEFDTN